jgi:hypothetical protein
LGELYFDQKINNYILINKEEGNVKIDPVLLKKHSVPNYSSEVAAYYKPKKCISVDYRL